MAVRAITPSAEQMFRWIEDTYKIGRKVDAWCLELAGEVLRGVEPEVSILLENVFGKLAPIASWAAEQFLRGLRDRSFGEEIQIASKIFHGLSDGCIPIEVVAFYRVQNDTVT